MSHNLNFTLRIYIYYIIFDTIIATKDSDLILLQRSQRSCILEEILLRGCPYQIPAFRSRLRLSIHMNFQITERRVLTLITSAPELIYIASL